MGILSQILTPKELEANKNEIGVKAINLRVLTASGFNVPDFVVIPSSAINELWQQAQEGQTVFAKDICKKITETLNCESYAVRSAALTEDTKSGSNAGQFLTKTNVNQINIQNAILEVVNDAYKKLGGKIELFSIIVQKFIPAEYSGVTFTRSPLGGREMVIEYNAGLGENIVGGNITPKRLNIIWTNDKTNFDLPGLNEAIKNFKKIEKVFEFPQDIEWCLKNNKYFILQSRPLTSVSQITYQQSLFLDQVLPVKTDFQYEKTEISEIAPRPKNFTKSLLDLIYSSGGPVQKVYEKFRINFNPEDFLVIVGNELYTDREKEIKTLLPSYSFFNLDLQPKFHSFNGFFKTIKNIWKLNLLPLNSKNLEAKLQAALNAKTPSGLDIQAALGKFLKDYEIIFEVNLLAEKAIKRLSALCSKYNLNQSQMLLWPLQNVAKINLRDNNLLGNSLDVSDTAPFYSRLSEKPTPDFGAFNKLSALQKAQALPVIETAAQFNRLREYGRWLTVKHINTIREELFELAKKHNFLNNESIYFFSYSELCAANFNQDTAKIRKIEYDKFSKFELPGTLSSQIKTTTSSQPLTVSPGKAKGQLLEIANFSSEKGSVILYTKILSADLVNLFPKISGIISVKGGMLSHLAIMARESGLPVITNVSLSNLNINLGDTIIMDSETSTIKKV